MIQKDIELIELLKSCVSDERLNLINEKINERTRHFTIILEDIYQGRNISASLRSADCFGIQDVHIIENNHKFKDDREVSLGSSKWLNLTRYNTNHFNSINALQKIKKNGYKIIAATPHNANVSLYEIDIREKIAIVFGSEVNGCSQETLDFADYKMKIPMFGFTESFNISVSVSLCLQHLCHKLRKSNINYRLTNEEKKNVILKWLKNSIKLSQKIEERYIKKN